MAEGDAVCTLYMFSVCKWKVLLIKHEFEYLIMKLQIQGREKENRLALDQESRWGLREAL